MIMEKKEDRKKRETGKYRKRYRNALRYEL